MGRPRPEGHTNANNNGCQTKDKEFHVSILEHCIQEKMLWRQSTHKGHDLPTSKKTSRRNDMMAVYHREAVLGCQKDNGRKLGPLWMRGHDSIAPHEEQCQMGRQPVKPDRMTVPG
jgi:hypothetical protein